MEEGEEEEREMWKERGRESPRVYNKGASVPAPVPAGAQRRVEDEGREQR